MTPTRKHTEEARKKEHREDGEEEKEVKNKKKDEWSCSSSIIHTPTSNTSTAAPL